MTNDNATRPAFPGYSLREGFSGKIYDHHLGLSKREYFAGIALQALLTTYAQEYFDGKYTAEAFAAASLVIADEILNRHLAY
jgi:hypothetical protein